MPHEAHQPFPIAFHRERPARERFSRGHAWFWNAIKRGIMVPPTYLGKTPLWADHELRAMAEAILAGAADDDLKSLVTRLVAERPKLDQQSDLREVA